MALYKETSYDDWARRQRQNLANSAQNLQQKQAGLEAAQNAKQKTTLESALSGLVGGLKERGSDIFNTAKNMAKTAAGFIGDRIQDNATDLIQKDDSKRRNEIAKKYGFGSYSEAINSGKVGDDFWNEIKSNNEQTKSQIKNNTNPTGSFGDVTKVNTNEAKGQALNTIDSVLGLLPGGLGAAANIAGGGISGIGDEYKAAGRENRDINWENARNNALIGAASGAAGMAGGNALGNAASKLGGNALGKLAGSQLAKGIAGGAASGAVGGGLGTYLNGGSLEDALLAAKEGAKAGAIGGGVMAGTMGLGGTALNKFRNRGGNMTTPGVEPMEATTVRKNRIEAPNQRQLASTVEAVEPISTRRGIAITDLDAGEQPVNVRNARQTASRGKYIDGIVRGENLPEAQKPTYTQVAEPVIDTDGNFFVNDGVERIKTINGRTATYTGDDDWNGATVYSQDGRGLPDGYKLMFDENAAPTNNYVAIENPNGNKALIELPQSSEYDYERVGMATGRDREGLMDSGLIAPEGGFRSAGTPRNISIESALGQTQDVPVENLATNYRKSTIPARQYDQQTVRNIPEAETMANRALATTPEQRVATQEPEIDYNTQIQRQKAQIQADKLKRQAIGGVMEQYGTTRLSDRIEGLPNAIEDMLKLGFTERAEIDNYAKQMTGKDSEIAKAIRKSLNDAGATDISLGITMEDVFASSGAEEAAQKKIKSFFDARQKKYATDNGTIKRADLYDLGKELEKEGYKKYDRGVRNQNTTDQAYGEALITLSEAAIGKATDGVDVSKNIDLNKLIAIAPDNAEHIARMENLAQNAKTVQDLRSAMANATKLNLLKQAEEYNRNTYGQNQGDFGKNASNAIKGIKAANSRNPVIALTQAGVEMASESPKMKQKAIKKAYEKSQKYQSQANGEAPIQTGKLAGIKEKIANIKDAGIVQGAKNLGNNLAERVNKNLEPFNNESLSGIDSYTTTKGNKIEFNSLGNQAQQFANKQLGLSESNRAQNRLENAQAVANAQSDYDNALADYNAQEATYNNQMAQLQSQNANSQLDRIANAMELALNTGDIEAYGQLANLYQQAAKIEELRNPTTAAADLTSAQKTKLNELDTSLNTLEQLKNAYEQAGGAKGLAGILSEGANKLTGGALNRNLATYNDLKNSLGMAIVKNVVNAGGTEQDAQRYTAMLPSASDSPEQAAQKFAYLEEMLNNAKQSVTAY